MGRCRCHSCSTINRRSNDELTTIASHKAQLSHKSSSGAEAAGGCVQRGGPLTSQSSPGIIAQATSPRHTYSSRSIQREPQGFQVRHQVPFLIAAGCSYLAGSLQRASAHTTYTYRIMNYAYCAHSRRPMMQRYWRPPPSARGCRGSTHRGTSRRPPKCLQTDLHTARAFSS